MTIIITDRLGRIGAPGGAYYKTAQDAIVLINDLKEMVRHYNFWFGDSCSCDESPCPLTHQRDVLAT